MSVLSSPSASMRLAASRAIASIVLSTVPLEDAPLSEREGQGERAPSRLRQSCSASWAANSRQNGASVAPLQVAGVVAGRPWLAGEQADDPAIVRGSADHGSRRVGP
jgi:hypothetical protein